MSASKQWVFFFGDELPEGVSDAKALLGGKGASLSEMTRAGLRVPPGFTISTECCKHFFENGRTWPEGLEQQVRQNLRRLEQVTGRTLGKGKQPLLVSVRSGAAASMPGMMDTILNCGLHPGLADELGDGPHFWGLYAQFILMFAKTVADIPAEAFEAAGAAEPPSRQIAERHLAVYGEKAGRALPTEPWPLLVECIDAVFRSWNSERAQAYRKRNNIRGLLGTAVNIQAMFPSRVSGIVFTQDPNNLPAQQMVIESSFGLGEAVVSGDVTPDRFVVKRDDFSAVQTFLGHKSHRVAALGDQEELDASAASLTGKQIAELCELSLKVERHFGKPMDIEWGLADGDLAVLQCRPIRGIDVAEDVEPARQEEILRLRLLAGDKRRVWVAHNLGETLRAPTPLTWDIVRRFMSGSGGFGLMYRDFGYLPSRQVCCDGFLELICGRIYADVERTAQLFWEGMPMTYDLDAVLKDKKRLDRAPDRFDAERADGRFLMRLPGIVRAMLRSSKIVKRARKAAREAFENDILPPYLRYVRENRRQDLSALATPEVIRELNDRCARVLDDFGKESLKPGFFGGMAYDALEGMLAQLMGRQKGAHLASALTAALDGDTTFEQDELLYGVAKGQASMAEFLEKFGHRAAGEMELAEPRWREDVSYLEQITRQVGAAGGLSPHEKHQRNLRKKEAAQRELPAALEQWGGSSFREQIEQDLQEARDLLAYRESGKHYLMMGYELLRLAVLELGRRWDLGSDVFFLRLDELEHFESDAARLVAEIPKRKVRWQACQRLDMPDVIDSDELETLGLPRPVQAAGQLQGDAVASGISTGPARIVFDPRKAGDIGVNYILVCPSTDPGWTPLFMNARGLVVERGGVLSHGAIVARDFGIPAVVCPNATSLIRPGQMIRLDGNRGHITILDSAGAEEAEAEPAGSQQSA